MVTKETLINSIFYPRKHHSKDEKDLFTNSNENTSISARFFISDKSYPTILLFHGNAEIAQDYDDIANYYNQHGMNLIVSDYQGYGLSEGSPTKDNLHSDALAIFDFSKEYMNKNNLTNKLVPMGRSLGSASVAHIMDNRLDSLHGSIIESGFATEYPLLSLMNINPDDISFKLSDGFDNLRKFKDYNKPLFVIHADLDDIVPMSQADMIMIETNASSKELFKVNGANHNNILMYARDEYFTKIKSFIDSL